MRRNGLLGMASAAVLALSSAQVLFEPSFSNWPGDSMDIQQSGQLYSSGMYNRYPGGQNRDDDKCPPCFNCMLPTFECKQFASCNEYTGRCDCPAGFGGDDCSEPVCGSLASGHNRPKRNGTSCGCDDGWGGINCNMCENDNVCTSFIPGQEQGVCYKGGIVIDRNYQMCKVTNRKILDILAGKIPEVTFSCNKTKAECEFQFWIDQKESFYCGLNDCKFDYEINGNHNTTNYQCEDIQCRCIPDRMLCGEAGSIDITDFLKETIKGPGHFSCDIKDSGKKCSFSEPSMNDLIKSVFGDPHITLECNSSECVHHTELPGYKAPKKRMAKGFTLTTLFSAVLLMAAGLFLLDYFIQKSNRRKYARLPSDDESSKLMTNHKPASLQFENISYADGNRAGILSNIFGSVQPGEVMAIMGGSGAGKTTLLDILAAKNKRGDTKGSVLVNGKPTIVNGKIVGKAKYNQVLGFVDQDDCLMPTLTVYETVVMSAMLRLPKSMSEDSKIMRAIETMTELGILNIRDQLIGSETNRGISGGEKRRVAIACELVTSPAILFLDEPTSGLDAFNAYNVVESLVQLARNFNRTVVFTIHQPRSNIVALFDKLVLLARGQLVYSGPQAEVSQFFADLGQQCPTGYNVGDFLIDMTMQAENDIKLRHDYSESDTEYSDDSDEPRRISDGDDSSDNNIAESEAQQSNHREEDEDLHRPPRTESQEMDSTREWRHYESHRIDLTQDTSSNSRVGGGKRPVKMSELVQFYLHSAMAQNLAREIESAKERAEAASTSTESSTSTTDLRGYPTAGVLGQFWILSGRTFKNLYRDPMLLTTHYVMAILLGIFCGVLYYDVPNDISGFQNRLGLFFFLLALFGFSTLTTLHLFAEERVLFIRERANGYYKPFAYYAAKVIFDIIPLRVLPPVLLGLIVYPLVGLNTEGYSFIRFLLILVLFNLTAASTCLLIGVLIQNTSVASLIGCLVMLFSLLFAGLFLNQESVPTFAMWFKYLSIFHYAYEALAVNEVRFLTLTEKKYGLSIEVPGATILSTFGFDNNAMLRDVLGLCIFFGVFIVAGYIAMHFWLVERR